MTSNEAAESALLKFSDVVYREIIDSQSHNLVNTFVSPMSVYLSMLMTLAGSSGKTKSEMLKALQISESAKSSDIHTTIGKTLMSFLKPIGGVDVTVSNRLFVAQEFKILETYQTALEKSYESQTENLAFAENAEKSRVHINNWISEATKNKIKELIPCGSITQDTLLVIANALYFKGEWGDKFNKEHTKEDTFHMLRGGTVQIPFMYKKAKYNICDLPELESQVVRIPFRDCTWEMVIVLPNAKDGLPNVLQKLKQPGVLQSVMNEHCIFQEIILRLPKFKLGGNIDPLDFVMILRKLGMISLFCNEADLSEISKTQNLCVSQILHKAILEVDEEGATAAAATAVIMLRCCMMMTLEIKIDHPFFVALVRNKNVPIFMGHVLEPEKF